MKKMTLKILLASLAMTLVASVSFAAFSKTATISDTTGGSGETISVRLSPNVVYDYEGASESYIMATRNTSGSKTYGAISTEQGMRSIAGIATALPALSTGFDSTWIIVGQ